MTRSLRERAFDRRGFAHSQRVYDWWSRHDIAYSLFVNSFLLGREATFRKQTVAALALDSGNRVLDVGCGPGRNFEYLAESVGPTGTIVGVDASQGMAAHALRRAQSLTCEASALRTDATRLPVRDDSFDAACATLSLSAMEDVDTVLERVSDALRTDGRVAILETRSFQTAPGRWLNPLVEGVSAYLTNWHPETDIEGAVARTFDDVTVQTFHRGTVYIVSGRNPP